MKLKILNLYAGIGGNRRLWNDKEIEVTAVEHNPQIATIYQHFFPDDKVIVGDAHKYLLEHYKEFDFIWSSPPCPTHSKMGKLHNNMKVQKTKYPDMKLYEEIIFLQHFFKGKYCVENVFSYYEPLIKPQNIGRHFYWANFIISNLKEEAQQIVDGSVEEKQKILNIDLSKFPIPNVMKIKVLNNCVNPKLGLHIFNCAYKEKQKTLLMEE